jgi:hypothetical protein
MVVRGEPDEQRSRKLDRRVVCAVQVGGFKEVTFGTRAGQRDGDWLRRSLRGG